MGVIGWSECINDAAEKQKNPPVPDAVKQLIESKNALIADLRGEVAFLREVIRKGQENAGQTPDEIIVPSAEVDTQTATPLVQNPTEALKMEPVELSNRDAKG